jgi:uncharacterized OB-fold protein
MTRWFPDSMPVPSASDHTLPWWRAAAEHRLVVQTCDECGTTRHPPAPRCFACRAEHHHWSDLPGTGTVYTFTLVRQAFVAALADQLPYVVAAVDLDGSGGVRLVTNVVDCDPAEVHIGQRVEVVWEDMGPELALPRVRPC